MGSMTQVRASVSSFCSPSSQTNESSGKASEMIETAASCAATSYPVTMSYDPVSVALASSSPRPSPA